MKVSNGKKKIAQKRSKKPSASSEDDTEDISVVGASLSVGVRGVRDLVRAVSEGTREFQELLNNECSIIYECRVCRNLFRSVANFISHKRKYCRKHFRYFSHGFYSDQLESRSEVQVFPTVELEPEPPPPGQNEENWVKNNGVNIDGILSRVEMSPIKKMRSHQLSAEVNVNPAVRAEHSELSGSPLLCRLEHVPHTRSAVFQTVLHKGAVTDSMRQEIKEFDQRIRRQEATILPDGSASAMDQGGQHACVVCDANFPTLHALQRHTAVYHQMRTCYPCPLCKIFLASPWGVYRHLSKIHHKTEEQIRRLRAAVLSKSVKRELYQPARGTETPAVAAVSATARTEEEKWIAQFVGELHCAVCGKLFTRRAALAVHSVQCKKVAKVIKPVPEPVAAQPDPPGALRCEKCGKEFARRAVLTSHTPGCNGRVESSPRAHTCKFCRKVFPRRRQLTIHMGRCLLAVPKSPLRALMTPPKMTTLPSHVSPSAIQVRRDYNKLSPFVSPRNVILSPRPPLSKLEAVVRKLQEQPSPKVLLVSTLRERTKSPTLMNVNNSLKGSSVLTPINGSRLILSPEIRPCPAYSLPLQDVRNQLLPNTRSGVSPKPDITFNDPSTKVASPIGEIKRGANLQSPLEEDSTLSNVLPIIGNISEMGERKSPNPKCDNKIECQGEGMSLIECVDISGGSSCNNVVGADLDCASKPDNVCEMDVTYENDCQRTAVEEEDVENSVSAEIHATHNVLSSNSKLQNLENSDESNISDELEKPNCNTTLNPEIIELPDSPESSSEKIVVPIICINEFDGNERSTTKNPASRENYSRPFSDPVFIEPVTPVSFRTDSPAPAATDTLSDIELLRDSIPSSPIPYTEETRQETDSDLISLTSRGTERSEDSCSTRGDTPPTDPTTSFVADDSGVSDDECLPEVVELDKRSPFRGFDSPALQDQLPIARLSALVNDLNAQIDFLDRKGRRVQRIYHNGSDKRVVSSQGGTDPARSQLLPPVSNP